MDFHAETSKDGCSKPAGRPSGVGDQCRDQVPLRESRQGLAEAGPAKAAEAEGKGVFAARGVSLLMRNTASFSQSGAGAAVASDRAEGRPANPMQTAHRKPLRQARRREDERTGKRMFFESGGWRGLAIPTIEGHGREGEGSSEKRGCHLATFGTDENQSLGLTYSRKRVAVAGYGARGYLGLRSWEEGRRVRRNASQGAGGGAGPAGRRAGGSAESTRRTGAPGGAGENAVQERRDEAVQPEQRDEGGAGSDGEAAPGQAAQGGDGDGVRGPETAA